MRDAQYSQSTLHTLPPAFGFPGIIVAGVPPESTPPSTPGTPRTHDGLLRVALALFAVGFLAIVAIFLTPVVSDSDPGLVLYLIALACPIGFLLGIVAALRQGRRTR